MTAAASAAAKKAEASGSSSGGGGGAPTGGGGARGPPSLFQPMPQLTFQTPYNPHVHDDYNVPHSGPNASQQSPPSTSTSGAIKPTSTAALNGTTLAGSYIHRNDSPFDPSQLRKEGGHSPGEAFEGGADAGAGGRKGGSTSSASASASASTAATSLQQDEQSRAGGSGTPSHQPGVEREYGAGGGVLSFASEVEFWESQAFGRRGAAEE